MYSQLMAGLAVVVVAGVAYAQTDPVSTAGAPEDSFMVNYLSNPAGTAAASTAGVVTVTNAGHLGGLNPGGNICVNVYVYDADEQPRNCCTCLVTPNGIKRLTGLTNPLFFGATPDPNTGLMVKLVATTPLAGGTACNAAAPASASTAFASGIRAWAIHVHTLPTGTLGITETEFSKAPLSISEFVNITGVCNFIQTNASGKGVCGGCVTGATPGTPTIIQ